MLPVRSSFEILRHKQSLKAKGCKRYANTNKKKAKVAILLAHKIDRGAKNIPGAREERSVHAAAITILDLCNYWKSFEIQQNNNNNNK